MTTHRVVAFLQLNLLNMAAHQSRMPLQILRGDGADGQYYRERVFVGTDGAPVTLQVLRLVAPAHASPTDRPRLLSASLALRSITPCLQNPRYCHR